LSNKRKKTETDSFGSRGRESHDSSKFYNSKLYEDLNTGSSTPRPEAENRIPQEILDTVIFGSSEKMSDLPDNCVHLMVTSPPYNVGKDYDEDLSLDVYLGLLDRVFREVYRVLVHGGRACINVANLGRKPYIPLNSEIARIMNSIGFLMRGEIIWDKAASAGSSTAWGSWQSPSNPTLRDVHEYILVFSKESYKRPKGDRKPTITRDDFLEVTKSIWSFPTESARKVGHPAPFPVKLPLKLIHLYTYESEIILDPFMGSGSTAVAAIKSNRHFVGYDIDRVYISLCEKRIEQAAMDASQLDLFDSQR